MQNTSHAVMSQRSEPRDSLDDFPTPPWAARALCEHVIAVDKAYICLEPACNRGFLERGLRDYFIQVLGFDVHNYGRNLVRDFLSPRRLRQCDWVITNPPFRLAEQFAMRAFDCATKGVALLVRTQFLESKGRFERLFVGSQPCIIAQFVERVPMVRGRCDPKASTATSYCWIVWTPENSWSSQHTEFVWIPPCRRRLEQPGDYNL